MALVVIKNFGLSVHQVNSDPVLCIVNKNHVVFSMPNSPGCGRSPDITVDEFAKLSGSFSGLGGSLCLCQKTGLTGGSRFVS